MTSVNKAQRKSRFLIFFCATSLALMSLLFSHASLAQDNQIISILPDHSQAVIRIKLKEAIQQAPSLFILPAPDRVVTDFLQASNGTGKKEINSSDAWLRSIDIIEVSGRTRLVFNLKQAFKNPSISVEGDTAVIRLSDSSDVTVTDTPYKDPVQSGVAAPELFNTHLVLARAGRADAQFSVGEMYRTGYGISPDVSKALHWFRLAAQQGNANAQAHLAVMYREGSGIAKDAALAGHWFLLAARQGVVIAQLNLGYMYREGQGLAKNAEKAVYWYRQAAEKNDPDAQLCLAGMYYLGEGVKKDLKQTEHWALRSARQDYLPAQKVLAQMYASDSGIRHDETDAVFWYRKAAEQGDQEAQQILKELSR
ncbi:AMIN domain-containing protein [Undibacterium sp. TJN19]|uniref:AMIN domain-containing protein n=1 Tax=Undibacterium sp. TJN19 TaxID=3413055 RepID=UPI003BF375FE